MRVRMSFRNLDMSDPHSFKLWIVIPIADGGGLPVGVNNFEMKLERIDSSTDPLQRGYDAAWMLATCTVFVALSKVPVTVTF